LSGDGKKFQIPSSKLQGSSNVQKSKVRGLLKLKFLCANGGRSFDLDSIASFPKNTRGC
jgi:hypothetical protein